MNLLNQLRIQTSSNHWFMYLENYYGKSFIEIHSLERHISDHEYVCMRIMSFVKWNTKWFTK